MQEYKELTPFEIAKWLTVLPAMISEQAKKAESKQLELRIKKHEVEIKEAQCYLIAECKPEFDKKPQRFLDAQVQMDPALQKLQADVIYADSAWRQEDILYKQLENKFVALRKIAEIRKTELRTMPE